MHLFGNAEKDLTDVPVPADLWLESKNSSFGCCDPDLTRYLFKGIRLQISIIAEPPRNRQFLITKVHCLSLLLSGICL